MTRGKSSIFFYTIISLAVIGILTKLFTHPLAIFKSLLTIVTIAIVLLGVVYFIFKNNSKRSSREKNKYKQAVKQSKLKYVHHNHSQKINNKKKRQNHYHKRKPKRRRSHLRVIDGKKDKNNDRANF